MNLLLFGFKRGAMFALKPLISARNETKAPILDNKEMQKVL